jgi:hypothetical protein
MSQTSSSPGRPVLPDRKTPKVLGIISIVLGAAFALCNLSGMVMLAAAPYLASLLNQQSVSLQKAREARWSAQINDLKTQIDQTDDPQLKQTLQTQLAAAEAQKPEFAPMGAGFEIAAMKDPRVQYSQIAEHIVSFIIAILLIFSGIGLIKYRPSGRTLALATAIASILVVLIANAYKIAVVIPLTTRQTIDLMKQQMAAGGNAAPGAVPGFLTDERALAGIASAQVVAYALLSLIFPIIVLFLLNTRRVKAAFGLVPSILDSERM